MTPLFGPSAATASGMPPSDDQASRGARSSQGRVSRPVVFQAAALVLSYPDEQLLLQLDTIEKAVAGTGAEAQFAPVLANLDSSPLSKLQSFHIQEFDLSRRHALHLTYWTDGDTRRRGEVLAGIKQTYRDSGLLVDTGGELPDFLPMVLEFAVADPERGGVLLQRFRASLELLRLGLAKDGVPHAGVLAAICGCLPGPSPQTHAEIQARYGENRPVEFVGLDSVEGLLQRTRPSGAQPGTSDLIRHSREGGDLVTSSRGGS